MPYCFFFSTTLCPFYVFYSFISMFNQTLCCLCSAKPMQNTLSVVSLNTPNVIQVGSFQLDGCFKHCTLLLNNSNKDIEVFHIVLFQDLSSLHTNHIIHCVYLRLCVRMDDIYPLPPTIQKQSQNILDTNAAILNPWRLSEPESAQ